MRIPSATQRHRPRAARAFTLVEILLVLALLALGGAILRPSASALLDRNRPRNPEDTIATVLQQARRDAVLTGREVAMRFEADAQRFTWEGNTTSVGTAGPRMRIEFLRPVPGNAVLIGGQLQETSSVSVLRFFPDGTCDPVRVQVRVGDGATRILAIDPWTCAPGLEGRS